MYCSAMDLLLRTTDIMTIVRARTLLDEAGIRSFEFDVNMSILEGSIGILPRRLMVMSGQFDSACAVLTEGGMQLDT